MQITISEDCMMYIYLKDSEEHKHERTKTRSDICCFLLYDAADNLLGIRIINKRDGDESLIDIHLPKVGEVEFPMYNAIITESEQEILILFDQDTPIAKEAAHTCVIDVCKSGIIGIEPLPYVNVGGKEMMKPFIIRDEANPVYYVLSRPAMCICSSNSFAEIEKENEDLEMCQGWECVECGQVYFLMRKELGELPKNADMSVEEAIRLSREEREK
ncbi:hypothetical protein ACFWMP_18345 [Paenibacillus sp. NPDC058367]|uniref:hypothetical protein n=1 Tax=Paenibacillus sp. NPDC058367 TaxID=3346460 RepID=UPI003650B021